MSAGRGADASARDDAVPGPAHEASGPEGIDDERLAGDQLDELDAEDLGDDPDDVPEVNAWLTIVMFALFIATTIGCYFWLDGWH